MSSVHVRIKRLREARSMSMEALAKAIDVAWQTVQQWENGKTAPKRARLNAVANALGTTVDYLLTGGASSPQQETDINASIAEPSHLNNTQEDPQVATPWPFSAITPEQWQSLGKTNRMRVESFTQGILATCQEDASKIEHTGKKHA